MKYKSIFGTNHFATLHARITASEHLTLLWGYNHDDCKSTEEMTP